MNHLGIQIGITEASITDRTEETEEKISSIEDIKKWIHQSEKMLNLKITDMTDPGNLQHYTRIKMQ